METYYKFLMYKNPPIKDYFPSLVEKYTSEQLFLISILFMELIKISEYIDVSEAGQKYWTWTYENTDDDIRAKITKEFEDAS